MNASLLQLILSLGNALNDGTRHVADGFKIDTLPKLSEVFAADNKTTLLRYVVETVAHKAPALVKWTSVLPSLKNAMSLTCEGINAKVADLELELEAGSLELLHSEDEPTFKGFCLEISSFLRASSIRIPQLREDLKKTDEAVAALLRYFGESPSGGLGYSETDGLFRVVATFARAFEAEAASLPRCP